MKPLLSLLGLAILAPAALRAQPTEGRITAGTGTIATAGPLTQITQASDRLIIDWGSFSIPTGATVDFAQPGALAAVLNRVTGSEASLLLGTLRANGQVYLLNPHGVLIGPEGRVDTAGFIAATTRLDNADFLRGSRLSFAAGTDAGILNQGVVNAVGGPVLFIARHVENRGTLSAPGGTVQLVGGTEVLLATMDSPAVIRTESAAGTVANSPAAAIAAAQVRLQAAGNNPAALAINQEGLVRATGVAGRNGEVWLVGGGEALVAQRGVIAATNADGTGGAVYATGGRLLVADGSRTGADGPAGGGIVHLGGAEQGRPTALPNARQTLVEAGAVVSADATGAGSGGRVVAWGNEALGFYGTIFARGAGGAGGQVETSSAWLDAFGRVETGPGGQWLLDPFNIRVVDGPSSGFSFSGTNPVVGRPTASESRVDVRALEQALGSQGRVILDTGTAGSDVGNIIIDAPVYYQDRGTARLTLNAANDIFVNHTITSLDGQLDLDFNADFDANGQGKVILGSDLITSGGTVTFQEDVVTGGNAGLAILSGGGDIIFAGDLRLENIDGLDLSSQGGDILMASLGASTQRDAVLRLTDVGPRNLYSLIAALLSNPTPTPAATIGQEAGKLVKRRALRRVNNPPSFTTVAWQGFKQDPGQQPTDSQVSSGNFGPVGGGNKPFDDSYLDAPFANRPPTGKPPGDDSYMDVAVPNTPFWAQNNPPTGTNKPAVDDSYMDFPFRPQTGGTAQTPTPNGPRPTIDDSYMDFPPKPATGGTTGPSNQGNPVIVQTDSGPVFSTVTTADANGPQVGPGQTTTTVSVVAPTGGSSTSTVTTGQPPIVVTGGPTQISSVNNSNGPQIVTELHPTIQVGGPTTGSPTIVTQVVAQPQPVDQRPVVVQAVPQVPTISGPQNNTPALQGPNTPTVSNQPVVIAAPTLPVVVNNPPVVSQPPAQQPGPVIVQAVPTLPVVVTNPPVILQPPAQQPGTAVVQSVPQVPVIGGPQNNLPALQVPNTPTVVATQPVAVAVPTLPIVVNNPPVVAQPPVQQPGPVIVQAVPQVPTNSGPQNNLPALQAPNTPTVTNQPALVAVPSLPVVVNNPPANVPQPPPAQQPPVVAQLQPPLPMVSGPQNNLPALQAPNTPTVVNQPVVVAVPSLPVVVNNPPVIPQPPAQQPGPVIVQAVPQVPMVSGPQNNLPALQAPNTPTVVATNPTVMAVPTLPVVVNNPPVNVPQPPPAQQPPVVAQLQPALPVVSGPQNNLPALQGANTPTITTQPIAIAVPTLPVVVTNPTVIPQPPAQQPGPVIAQAMPQAPTVSGPQNNLPALQGPNTPTVSNQPVVVAVPSLPVVVNNPPVVPQPPAQQPGPTIVQAVPQIPTVSGPQNNLPALQAPNTPTVVATNPTVVAVPSLPAVVNNPPVVPQPPAQQPGPVIVQAVPQVPTNSGPQNNLPALQGANTPTVINQPVAVAVPSLPVVVTNPPVNVPQPPPAQQLPVVAQLQPPLPVVGGPQNNAPALQAPNTPTVVATNPTVVAVPSLPVVVNNPPTIPQPPAQQPGPVIVQAVPQVPTVSGPQNNLPALQAPNPPTVVNQPVAVAVPSLPVVVNNPPVVPQPPTQQPGPVIVQAVPQIPTNSGPQNNLPALQAPNTPTVVATNPTVVAVPSLPAVVNNPPVVPQPPAQQPGVVVAQAVPQLPVVGGPQYNLPALQGSNPPTVVATQPIPVAVPSLPVVVNNPPVVAQPPALQPGPVVLAPVPQVPLVSGPQNNLPALQGPNVPTVIATQPTAVAVPSLPVVVNNPPVLVQPPAQPVTVVLQAVPQVPTISGPQNNAPALQDPNAPTVVATNPTVVAVPSLPVAVSNPPTIPQPSAQQPGPVVVQAVPQVPTNSGPQNNLPALQGANTPTVINQPVAVAVPSLPVVVTNPPVNVPQPPPAQQLPVVAQLQPPLPVVGGPQNNAPALQAPNTPTVVATNPTVVAVPSLPVVVNNPPTIPQPPAQQPGPVIVQAVPQVPVIGGPQNNLPALQAPNPPTVINQPAVVAVPSLPVVVNNPPVVPQPPAQQPGVVVAQAVPQLPVVGGPQNNLPALQGANTPTVVATQPVAVAVPTLPVIVNNPPVVAQPPVQQPGPVIVQAMPQVPTISGPQNNTPALQGPNTPTVVVTQPTAIAVPTLPVVVNNPPVVVQPPAQPVTVVMQPVPQVPIDSGPQNNAPALQGPNVPTVVATQPTAVAVPTLPVVVNNPPVVAQPPVQQPGPVIVQAMPQVPTISGPQNNTPALQGPNTPTVVATQSTAIAVPTLPVVVNNPPVVVQPPAQPVTVVMQPVPQVPIDSGPQNNAPALQGPNVPTVVATQPTAVAVPTLPVVVNNPPVVAQPPVQQPGPVIVQAMPQVPTISGPQNNTPALQGPNTPTVVTTQPTAIAVPTLPVVVSNPPVVVQPPAQPVTVVMQPVPQVPVVSGPQNNAPALQGPNLPTVVATQPTVVAVPTLPVVVNNPPVVAQPPGQPPGDVVATNVPPLPVITGPQNNAPALQGPNTPTVVATQPIVVAVPSLPVVVNNPTVVLQPPTQPLGPGVVQAVPQIPTSNGPQNNAPALQGPNPPTVVNQPVVVAVPSIPTTTTVTPPPTVVGPDPQPVVITAVSVPTFSQLEPTHPGAVQGPVTTTVITQTTSVVGPPQTGGGPGVGPIPNQPQVSVTVPGDNGGTRPTDLTQTGTGHGPDVTDGGGATQVGPQQPGEIGSVVDTASTQLETGRKLPGFVRVPLAGPGRESELIGLHYSVIYRNYETQTLVNDIGRPLYALSSGYELFLYLEGRRPKAVAVPLLGPPPQ